MSKFCTSCGASLDDNATFCTACGTKLAAPAAAPAANDGSAAASTPLDDLKDKSLKAINDFKNNPQRNTYIGIACVAVLAIILIIVVVSLISGGYKGALKDYFGAIEDKDGEAYAEALMSDDMIDYILDESGDDEDDFYDGYKDSAKSAYNSLKEEFGSGISISFDVTDKEKIDKDDLEDIEDALNMLYDDVKVSKGYEIELEIEVEGKDDDDTFDAVATMLKVDGDWIISYLAVDGCRPLNVAGMGLDGIGSIMDDLGDWF